MLDDAGPERPARSVDSHPNATPEDRSGGARPERHAERHAERLGSSCAFEVNEREVIHETLEGESVLVHLGTGTYFSLGGVAAEIWPLVVAGRAESAIVEAISRRVDAPRDVVERDVSGLLAELVAHQLARRVPAGIAGSEVSEASDDAARKYEPPRLESFEDMQQLLLLDPIHETGDEGWPVQAS